MSYEVLHVISQSVYSILANVIILMFFSNVYGTKYRNKLIYISAFLLWTGIMFGVNNFNCPPLNLAYFTISSELICLKLYNTSFRKSWLYNILLIFFIVFCDTVTYIMWAALLGKSYDEIASDDKLLIISNLLNLLVFYLLCRIFISIVEKNELKEIKIQESIFLLLMTAFESFVVYGYMINVNSVESVIEVIAILLGFLIFNIYITYITRKTADLYKYKYSVDLLQKQNEMQLAHYKDIDCKYQESRRIIHDMKKHLMVMTELNDSESGKAIDYGKMLEKRLDSLFCDFQCSNPILSIIISHKCSLAAQEKISVKTQVEDLTLSFMDDLDITGIFANLWDNAIEACSELEESQRSIDFIMRKVNGFIIINVENSCDSDNIFMMEDDRLLSTKENHMGVGLSVVKSLVEKYNGLFIIIRENGKFIVELTLPIPADNTT